MSVTKNKKTLGGAIMKIAVNDWAWVNCITKEVGIKDATHGHALKMENGKLAIYLYIECDMIKETEKAVNIQFPIMKKDGSLFMWNVWIPKKSIIENVEYYESDKNNRNYDYERYMMNYKGKLKNTLASFDWKY